MNDLVLNGTSLAQYGAIISAEGSWSSPERDITVIEIPGRSDPIMQDNGRWKPQKLKYKIGCVGGRNFDQIRSVLNSFVGGSIRLEDSYHPDEFRTAWITGEITPSMQVNNRLLEATVEFTADARRWLKSGETEYTAFSGNPITLNNPTMFDAMPKISLNVGEDVSVTFSTGAVISFNEDYEDFWRYFDTETMQCTKRDGTLDFTGWTVTNESKLVIPAGSSVTMTSTSIASHIIPRWYIV